MKRAYSCLPDLLGKGSAPKKCGNNSWLLPWGVGSPPIHNCTFFHIPFSKGTKKGLRQCFWTKNTCSCPYFLNQNCNRQYAASLYWGCLLLPSVDLNDDIPTKYQCNGQRKLICSVPLFNWRQKQFYEQQNMKKVSHRSAHLLGNHFPFLLLHLWQFLSSSSYCCVWRHVSSFWSYSLQNQDGGSS